MNKNDTIIAIATPPGRGGIGILRLSGKLVPKIIPVIFNKIPDPRKAEYLSFLSDKNDILEKVITIFFPEPNSFTGEDVLEIHGHGGPIILDLLIERILKISNNIRLANPGEFTERAFLNNKIDLIQAESISDIIDATSQEAAKSALNSLRGVFSKHIKRIAEKILDLRTYIECNIDFSEESIYPISYENVENKLNNIIQDVKNTYHSTCYGVLLKEGIKIVIVGPPNAGKSSLFNNLIGMNRAIISSISGTTRDTLQECTQLNGITLHITDTAGLKNNSTDEIEKIGMQRTWNEIKNADHILWVIDSSNKNTKDYDNKIFNSIENNIIRDKNTIKITIIRNKSDISTEPVNINTNNKYTTITLSVLLNNGIDLLWQHLNQCIQYTKQHPLINYNYANENQGNFIARRRHLNALEKTLQYLLTAQKQLNHINITNNSTKQKTTINELFAEDLKLAHSELNNILGTFTSTDLLKRIFNKFCIGK